MNKLNRRVLLLLFVLNSTFVFQQSFAEKYRYYINKDSLRNYVAVLTADSLSGRYTGTPGQQKAAAYIRTHFEKNNIAPLFNNGYYQPFAIGKLSPSGNITVNTKTLKYFQDYISFDQDCSARFGNKEILYVSEDVKAMKVIDAKDKFILLTEKEVEDFDNATLRKYFNHYKREGAAGIIFSTPTFEELKNEMENELTKKRIVLMDQLSNELDFPLFFVPTNFTDYLHFPHKKWERKFNKNKAIRQPLVFGTLSGQINPELQVIHTENVGGIIKGKKASNADHEHLIVMGHFDHLGVRNGDMYRGADDNASGIASILEMARIYGAAKQKGHELDRSVVFLMVSAEEIGLLGSEFYTLNPALPLSNTSAVLNIDMVGRENIDTLDKFSLYLIGADKINPELHEVNEQVNTTYSDLYLDYTYNEEDHPMRLYYRSDHYNFVKHDVPSVFYFGGFHDDYHKPTDTADKLNYDKLHAVTEFFFFTAWEIATQPHLLKR